MGLSGNNFIMESLIYANEQIKDFMGCLLTAGTHNFRVKNDCFWLFSDIIAVAITKLNKEDFLNCVLEIKEDTAVLKIDDGNNNILYTQKYKYTDLKKDIKFYAVKNHLGTYTLMLPEEY